LKQKEPCGYSLTPSLSPVGWGRESEGKRQTPGGWNKEQFHRMAKAEENNNQ